MAWAQNGRSIAPSADYMRDVARAWDRFVADEPIDQFALRPLVTESWKRCRLRGVDPSLLQAEASGRVEPLPFDGDASQLLITALRRCLGASLHQIRALEAAILVTDPAGVLLTIAGNDHFVERLRSRWATSEASWLEDRLGTNAIGTALALGRMVSIHSHEHFCAAAKMWNCHAVPLRDPYDGRVLGALDITHEFFEHSVECRQLLVRVASEITRSMTASLSSEHAELLSLLDGSDAMGMVTAAFDRAGRVIGAHGRLGEHGMAIGSGIPGLTPALIEMRDERQLLNCLGAGEVRWLDNAPGGILRLPDRKDPSSLRGRVDLAPSLADVVRSSPSLALLAARAQRYAARRIPILLGGETGTGKEILAKAIHASTQDKLGPFVAINCAAIPRDLIASELFGHVEGAFTGAKKGGMRGRIEDADGGTLFLDEVGDMPLELQPYLLRVLEERLLSRLGETKQRPVNIRIIAATNRSLSTAMKEGRFREDLFHRLNAASLELPPLRDRLEDLGSLVRRILDSMNDAGEDQLELGEGVMARLRAYRWPGNIRELRNVLDCMAAISPDRRLEYADLPPPFLQLHHAPTEVHVGPPETGPTHFSPITLASAMQAAGGRVDIAARMLGLSRATVYRRLAAMRDVQDG